MKTQEEIEKGLECCAVRGGRCGHCPYQAHGIGCTTALSADTLALIKQLEAEESNLISDFMDFVNSGVMNPAPFCVMASELCVDGRGWCKPGSVTCNGFIPKLSAKERQP